MIQKIATFVKKEPYNIDKLITSRDLFIFIVRRIGMLVRGLFFTRRIIFLGKRADLFYKHKILFGRSVTLNWC